MKFITKNIRIFTLIMIALFSLNYAKNTFNTKKIQDIADSCRDFSITYGSLLKAKCKNHQGTFKNTKVDLNRCLFKDNNIIMKKNFNQEANKFGLCASPNFEKKKDSNSKTYLEMTCNNHVKTYKFNLSEVLLNTNGALTGCPSDPQIIPKCSSSNQGYCKTCRNMYLVDSLFHAECKDEDNNWKYSAVDLNNCIGSNNGKLIEIGGRRQQSKQIKNCKLIYGRSISCETEKNDGNWRKGEVRIDSIIQNRDGKLARCGENIDLQAIHNTCDFFDYDEKKDLLSAQCEDKQKNIYLTKVYLNYCLSNDDGELIKGDSFKSTCSDCSITERKDKIDFMCYRCERPDLRVYKDYSLIKTPESQKPRRTIINLSDFIKNENGQFKGCGPVSKTLIRKNNKLK